MKRGIILVLLVVGLLLVSGIEGCILEDIIGRQPEEEAKQLADGTAEGSMATVLARSLAKIEDCTMNELISKLNMIYTEQGKGKYEPSKEEIAELEASLEAMKKCAQRIEKDVSKISESEYLVSHSFIVSANCQQPMSSSGGENFLQIEVNIATETTNVIKGAFDERQKQDIQTTIQMIEDMGDCGALMMMSTTSTSATPRA